MTIYFLRHAHRDIDDIRFDSSLNDNGKDFAATILKEKIKSLSIDRFYSSPFRRVLQTITPSLKTHQKIYVDYSIAENLGDVILKDDHFILTDEHYDNFPIDIDYLSQYDPSQYIFPETYEMLEKRCKQFCLFLSSTDHTNQNILICSHMDVLSVLIKILYNIDDIKLNMGDLITIQKNKIVYP